MSAAEPKRRRSAAIAVVALVLAAAPFLVARSVESFAPMWGAPSSPTWTAVIAVFCGLVSLIGGLRLIVRVRPETDRGSYYVAVLLLTVAGIVPLWVTLFWLMQLLAVVLTIPYAIGLTGLILWIRRR